MSQKQLEDTEPDFVPAGKFGYCCAQPGCRMYVFKYVLCPMCKRTCLGCTHDRPEERRRF